MTKKEDLKREKEKIKSQKKFLSELEEGSNWETKGFTPLIRYQNLKMIINDIILTSETKVEIPIGLYKILLFWDPPEKDASEVGIDPWDYTKGERQASIERRKESEEDLNESEIVIESPRVTYRWDDNLSYSTTMTAYTMSDWTRISDMLKSYLICKSDYYLLNRKIIIDDRVDEIRKREIAEGRTKTSYKRKHDKEEQEESDSICESDIHQSEDSNSSKSSSSTSSSFKTTLSNTNNALSNLNIDSNNLLIDNRRGESLPKFTSPVISIKELEQLTVLSHSNIEIFKLAVEHQRRTHSNVNRNDYIADEVKDNLNIKLFHILKDGEKWEEWNDEKFFEILKTQFPKPNTHVTENVISDCIKRLEVLKLLIDYNKELSEFVYINEVNKILRSTKLAEKATTEETNTILRLMLKNIEDRHKDKSLKYCEIYKQLVMHLRTIKITTFNQFLAEISRWVDSKRKVYNEAKILFGSSEIEREERSHPPPRIHDAPSGTKQKSRKERRAESFKNKPTPTGGYPAPKPQTGKPLCDYCGRNNHHKNECSLKDNHPDANKSGRWIDSDAYKSLQKGTVINGETKFFKELQFGWRLDGTKLDLPRKDGGGKSSHSHKAKKHKTSKSNTCNCHNDELYMLDKILDNNSLHTVSAQIIVNNNKLTVDVLFDTGALQSNYLNEETAGWITKHGGKPKKLDSRVCSAFNECVNITKVFNTNISFNVLANLEIDDSDNIDIEEVDNNPLETVEVNNKKRLMD